MWTKIVFPDPGLDSQASLRAGCDAVKTAARSEERHGGAGGSSYSRRSWNVCGVSQEIHLYSLSH